MKAAADSSSGGPRLRRSPNPQHKPLHTDSYSQNIGAILMQPKADDRAALPPRRRFISAMDPTDGSISPLALIEPGVRLGRRVIIHPFACLYAGSEIGDDCEINPGAFVGKAPKAPGTLLRPLRFEPRLVLGDSVLIGPHAVIYYDVEIGARTLIGDGVSIREQCRIGARVKIGPNATLNYNVQVGDDSQISNLVHVAGNTRIGRRVFIAAGVSMANDNSFGRASAEPIRRDGPWIDDDCRIGPGAVLLPGVHIGPRAIVGAGAVVSRDVAPDTLVMGVPARPVRTLDET